MPRGGAPPRQKHRRADRAVCRVSVEQGDVYAPASPWSSRSRRRSWRPAWRRRAETYTPAGSRFPLDKRTRRLKRLVVKLKDLAYRLLVEHARGEGPHVVRQTPFFFQLQASSTGRLLGPTYFPPPPPALSVETPTSLRPSPRPPPAATQPSSSSSSLCTAP